MRPLDIPEILIAIGLAACAIWAVYNWKRTRLHLHK